MGKTKLTNWGNYPRIESEVNDFTDAQQLENQINKSTIARGMGRCYGDAALASKVISTKSYAGIIHFDEETGLLHCQSGTTLDKILELIVPAGWFLPVTPGTKFISVGGAIAADIHGKNHHKEGSFSNHILNFTLHTDKQGIVKCSKQENPELFWATCGGMGLTGIILEATFQLKKIETTQIRQEAIAANNLKELMQAFENSANWTYTVAWLDCFAKGKNTGKGVLFRGEHALKSEVKTEEASLSIPKKLKLNIPFYLPAFTLNRLSIKAFNFLYYRMQTSKPNPHYVDYDSFFYPLDSIHNWNRMYGKKGFTQYQLLLPKNVSYQGISEILDIVNKSNYGSFLVVLKLFGKQEQKYLGFPSEGYTLTLDFPINQKVLSMLNQLDVIVTKYGGKVYLAKDVRVNETTFNTMYPNLEKFKEVVKTVNPEEKFSSLLSKRVGLSH